MNPPLCPTQILALGPAELPSPGALPTLQWNCAPMAAYSAAFCDVISTKSHPTMIPAAVSAQTKHFLDTLVTTRVSPVKIPWQLFYCLPTECCKHSSRSPPCCKRQEKSSAFRAREAHGPGSYVVVEAAGPEWVAGSLRSQQTHGSLPGRG